MVSISALCCTGVARRRLYSVAVQRRCAVGRSPVLDLVAVSKLAGSKLEPQTPSVAASGRPIEQAAEHVFKSCGIFYLLYEDGAKETPLEKQRVRTTVVMQLNVASAQADKFVDVSIDSVVNARLGRLDG